MTLGHILFGSVTYRQGGILLSARGAGERGLDATYECTVSEDGPSTPTVTVVSPGLGVGTVTVEVKDDVLEGALLTALRSSAAFNLLFKATQDVGDGTDVISGTVTHAGPLLGLLQYLIAGTGITDWACRDLITTGGPRGLLFPGSAEPVRVEANRDAFDKFEAELEVSLCIQDDGNFYHQTAMLERFRRVLYLLLKKFQHPMMTSLSGIKWSYGNEEKVEVAGKALDKGRLSVVFLPKITWSEKAFDDEYLGALQEINIGLWREPLNDPLGPDGDEALDVRISMTPTETIVTPGPEEP